MSSQMIGCKINYISLFRFLVFLGSLDSKDRKLTRFEGKAPLKFYPRD
jgi:hypothetical protein